VAYLAAPDEMLHSLLPQNNYSITGCISLFSDPIIPVSKEDAHRFQDDIQRIRERIPDANICKLKKVSRIQEHFQKSFYYLDL
jgi:hypothetical protein